MKQNRAFQWSLVEFWMSNVWAITLHQLWSDHRTTWWRNGSVIHTHTHTHQHLRLMSWTDRSGSACYYRISLYYEPNHVTWQRDTNRSPANQRLWKSSSLHHEHQHEWCDVPFSPACCTTGHTNRWDDDVCVCLPPFIHLWQWHPLPNPHNPLCCCSYHLKQTPAKTPLSPCVCVCVCVCFQSICREFLKGTNTHYLQVQHHPLAPAPTHTHTHTHTHSPKGTFDLLLW